MPPEGRGAPGLQAHPGTRTSPRLSPGPWGRHRPAEICPSTAGPPRLVRAARPVPAHRASSPQPDRRSASIEAWTRPCVRAPEAPRAPPCPAGTLTGRGVDGEGLPAPAPRLGGVTPQGSEGAAPGSQDGAPRRGGLVPSPQSPKRRSGPAGLPQGWKLPGSAGLCQKHELQRGPLERHCPQMGVHSTPLSVGGQAGWGPAPGQPPDTHPAGEAHTRRWTGGSRGRLEPAHHPPPN